MSNNAILAVPVLAACAFMLTMLYVTIEQALRDRRD
jgi:hypothetical protein